ncbi:MAG: glycosyltransferase, partial [Nitrospira sp.]
MKRWRLANLVTHPIQYQAPLLRMIAGQPEISLTTFFCTDFSLGPYADPGFSKSLVWDIPLTEGYAHEFLPVWGGKDSLSFIQPWIYGLKKRLVEGKFDALWVHGWGQLSHILAVRTAHRLGIKVLMRGEAGLHLPRHGPFKQWLKDRFVRGLFTQVDGFLAIGRLNRDFYLRYGVPEERVFMVPYAVDNAFFQEQVRRAVAGRESLRRELRFKPGRPVVLYASKMIERKRAEDLLEAFIRLSLDGQAEPPAYLLFVGDGDRRSALERRA